MSELIVPSAKPGRRADEHEPGQHGPAATRRSPRSRTTASPKPRPHLQPHRNILNLIENDS
jgi:hypothetical protein